MVVPKPLNRPMRFATQVHVNSLFWVSSLSEAEAGVTRRILEDLTPFFDRIGLPYQCLCPLTARSFTEFLGALARQTSQGSRPILHLDLHGSVNGGIRISASGETVSWPHLLEMLRTINIASGNNLCVI